MTSLTYRLPAELERRLSAIRADVQPPANQFMHEGKLNMGPTILLAVSMSAVYWALIIRAGFTLFH